MPPVWRPGRWSFTQVRLSRGELVQVGAVRLHQPQMVLVAVRELGSVRPVAEMLEEDEARPLPN